MLFDCDVVVVGGGPAGATAPACLARAGRTVVVLERETFPFLSVRLQRRLRFAPPHMGDVESPGADAQASSTGAGTTTVA